ncbi:P2Y purinoceptor 3-like [Coregonus clupeaformis]|uniref:P2Y purinoceptor 3-like n=1 Tax=Coregonus clupeaformis TaxID=59861 RepID=UPI001E1C9C6D|nr:P2Y purinoceptor 3-like [Coregonus clupeaformis]
MTTTDTPALNDDIIVEGVRRLLNSSSVNPLLPPFSCSINESYKYIFLPLCYSFTFLFSISLNSIVLWRSFRRTKRWNASLIYMVNLASTDFMYGLSLPFLVASYVMRDRWVFGDFMCRLVRFLFYFNLYCSIFFLTCISVHRYLGICHPMRTITLETKRAVKGTCVLVWGVVFALTCPIFRFAQTGHVMRGVGDEAMAINGNNTGTVGSISTGEVETYQNCWDDAIDKEFQDYVPYAIILHLLGFFLPFSIIAWCYSQVVLTIFRTLRSQPQSQRRGGGGEGSGKGGGGCGEAGGNGAGVVGEGGLQGGGEGMSIVLGAHSPYAHRRRKSIKTIITITLLFALCFFPFHVTRTIFFILKVRKGVPCHTMTMVSMCYKITRPLASFNAWLNALLYFFTKEKGGGAPCCPPPDTTATNQQHWLLWPLRKLRRAGDEEEGGNRGKEGGVVNNKGNNKETNKTPVHLFSGVTKTKVRYTAE